MTDYDNRGYVLIDGEWYDPEDLEAAAEMLDQLERISKVPQQNKDAGKMDEGKEVGGVVFVANDGAPEVIEPTEKALNFPATFVTT